MWAPGDGLEVAAEVEGCRLSGGNGKAGRAWVRSPGAGGRRVISAPRMRKVVQGEAAIGHCG